MQSVKPSVSAANKLRAEVLKMPGIVLLSRAGHVDQVIRFERVPDMLAEFKKPEGHYFINLDRGPDQEAWASAQRDTYNTARRDRPMPNPISVAPECKDEWAVGIDDVPVVENSIMHNLATEQPSQVMRPVTNVPNPIFKCAICTLDFNSEHALKIHKGRAHK